MATNMKSEIKHLENGDYQIVRTNTKDGSVKGAETFPAVEALDEKTIAAQLTAEFKATGTRRAAYQSLLGLILASKRLDGFKGTADKTTGSTSKEFKAALRDAESDIVKGMVEHGSIKLDKGKDTEIAFQEYMSALRDNKNYSNIKTYCAKYFAIVGHNCVTPSGRLVPQPIMVEETNAAMDRQPQDHSLAAQIEGVLSKLNATHALSEADAKRALGSAKMLLGTIEGILNDYSAKATEARNTANNASTAAHKVVESASKGASKAPAQHQRKAEPALV